MKTPGLCFSVWAVCVAAAGLISAASAKTITMDMATVGDAGNSSDSSGLGSVAYEYQIGKYEVTIGLYAEFLNAVATTGSTHKLYNPLMGSQNAVKGIEQTGSSGNFRYNVIGDPNKPVTYVSWFDAARFCNWLSSPTGDTENGSYTLSGSTSGIAPERNSGARFFVPNENEWYKAAYYDQTLNSGSGGFWSYATRSNTPPGNNPPTDPNAANHKVNGFYAVTQKAVLDPNQNHLTTTGAFDASPSSYGTFDQNGNVSEWCHVPSATKQITRGGNWLAPPDDATYRPLTSGTLEDRSTGFRIALAMPSSGIADPPIAPSPPGDVLVVHVSTGTQNQSTATGRSFLSGSLSLIKTGTGACVFDQQNMARGSAIVQAGTLELDHRAALPNMTISPQAGATLALSSTAASTTTIGGLRPNAGGLIDIRRGSMTVAAGLSKDHLIAALVSGRGDGSWTGTGGIISSTASAEVAFGKFRTVGWREDGGGSLTFGYAAPGDTNLDWQVDILDAFNLATGGKFNTGKSATWSEGDFNYDGVMDTLDAADFIAAALYNKGSYNPPQLPPGLPAVATVPEPAGLPLATVAIVAAAALAISRRTRS